MLGPLISFEGTRVTRARKSISIEKLEKLGVIASASKMRLDLKLQIVFPYFYF